MIARLLGAPWALTTHVRARLYATGIAEVHALPAPTVSVGALEMGGTGKTPTTAAVARLMQSVGLRPAIVSRGYGRSGSAPVLVTDGEDAPIDVRRSGDEPAWYAHTLSDVPVAVGARREEAARCIQMSDLDAFVLDDAFQHLRVARDVDLLVVDANRPFFHQATPPLGRLREGVNAAHRASAFLVIGRDPTVEATLERRWPDRPLWHLQAHELGAWPLRGYLAGMPTDEASRVALLEPCWGLSGIARPQRFARSLEASGVQVIGHTRHADHHWFRAADLARCRRRAEKAGARLIVTTEKDAMRLRDIDPERIVVWRRELRILEAEPFAHWLRTTLTERWRSP